MSKPKGAGGTRSQRVVTADLIREALSFIPADLDRDAWARVGMAVKASDLAEPAAFDLFNEWSSRGATYSEHGTRDTWRSVKAHGSVTVATLFGMAKDHGFRFPAAEPGAVQTSARSEAERLANEKQRQQAAEAAAYRQRADEAARVAVAMWRDASETGQSGYLERKGVLPHGVRFLPNGTLLVPMRDAMGQLQNLQRIAPAKPADGRREKLFLPGGRKSGLWHLLGSVDGQAALLVAEGYATAASLHEATGRPVAVAFDAGNLVHVSRELRALHPALLVLLCGDDDRETAERTGKNPGRDRAAAAARAVHSDTGPAGAVFPEGLPPCATDWNDLASSAGLQAVREQIETAIAAPQVPKGRQGTKPPAGGAAADAGEPDGPDSTNTDQARPAGRGKPDRWGFLVDERGVWHVGRDNQGESKKPVWLCAPLEVTARTRGDDANGWGFLLEWQDLDRNEKTWAMPSSLLSGDGAEWAGRLRDMGLDMEIGAGVRTLIGRYINTRDLERRVTSTEKVGWHGSVYVLPNGSIGETDSHRYVFQSDGAVEDSFRQRGSLVDWQLQVAAPASGNTRLVFTICCALAGPVLPFSGLEGGGFHLRGDSRGGKTTALRAAASVFGRPGYMQQWRTTANALESTAVQHNHALLVLDELGQLDPKEAGDTAYLLANGMDKNRATRGLIPRKRRVWQVLFLSSGEVSMSDLMADAGKRLRAGQEVRMVDVPLDAGAGMGGFEVLHEFDSAPELAEGMLARTARFYGTAGRAWIAWCALHYSTLAGQVREHIERCRAEFVPESCSGQVRTVGSRFALTAAAGEIATRAGVTGWQPGEATRAARACFEAWLTARGHLDNSEQVQMVRQVRMCLETNGDALFTWTRRAMDDHRPNTPMRIGFKRLVDEHGVPVRDDSATVYIERRSGVSAERQDALVEYLIQQEQFTRTVCKGFDAAAVARELRRRGFLRHDKGRLTMKQRLPGIGLVACYVITPAIFTDEGV